MKFPIPTLLRGSLAAFLVVSSGTLRSETTLLPMGSGTVWKYLDDGSTPDASWTTGDFDDTGWKAGPAPLGYGEEGLGTTLSFGDDPDAKPMTAYFRATFPLDAAKRKTIVRLGLGLRRDDGAVVYLNGREALRSNMPGGRITPSTAATAALGTANESRVLTFLLPATLLAEAGTNTVAVEVHQADPASSDLCLDLEIVGYEAGEVPEQDFHRDGMAAARNGDYEEAARLFSQVPPGPPEYGATMGSPPPATRPFRPGVPGSGSSSTPRTAGASLTRSIRSSPRSTTSQSQCGLTRPARPW